MSDFSTPDTRDAVLRKRINDGTLLVVADLAAEFDTSVHTIRRDLIGLERKGLVRRVRGGAMPLTGSSPSYLVRAEEPERAIVPLAERAARLIPETGTVFLDAGTTLSAVAARLPVNFRGLIVTPAPSVALAAMARGVRVHLIGGPLCPEGGMATGGRAERDVAEITADLCLLGACGLWPEFGLSAEDAGEAGVKRAMARASARVVVVSTAAKFDRRGRHRVLAPEEIDAIITDAVPDVLASFVAAGVGAIHV